MPWSSALHGMALNPRASAPRTCTPPPPCPLLRAAVGYGDYTPSWWLTQAVVVGMLLVAFTLLPLMTGRLVDALNQATKYQRGR